MNLSLFLQTLLFRGRFALSLLLSVIETLKSWVSFDNKSAIDIHEHLKLYSPVFVSVMNFAQGPLYGTLEDEQEQSKIESNTT